MKKTIEQLREHARQENAAYKRLKQAGYMCWGSNTYKGKNVMIDFYGNGKNWKTSFPDKRYYFKDFQDAAKNLLNGVEK